LSLLTEMLAINVIIAMSGLAVTPHLRNLSSG
jgi:hypothetical protein